MAARRSYGTGSLFLKAGNWHGRWYVHGRKVQRKIGPARALGERDGLTRPQAEREMRRRMEHYTPPVASRVTVEDAGLRLIAHLEALGRKRSTVEGYESTLRVHLVPFFGARPLDVITRDDVEAFMAHRARAGGAPKSTLNYLGTLHSVFEFARDRDWIADNPCKRVAKPTLAGDKRIRFLDDAELEALLRSTEDHERTLYLTAAMTGMRQGELLALQWQDVDWPARKIRVRRNYVRGEYGTPKSLRSTRAIPMGDRLGMELERHHQRSHYQADDALVFGHPTLGTPLDRSKVLKRFKAALKRAGVREVRFHDLRHTFGTRMAKVTQLRDVQEWMGHRDSKTTGIYADYMPGKREADLIDTAFSPGAYSGAQTERVVDSLSDTEPL
jgi:integrase